MTNLDPLSSFTTNTLTASEIRQNWENTFPARSFLRIALREDLILADLLRLHARATFLQLHDDLQETGLPTLYWHPLLQKHLTYFESRYLRLQSEFRKSLKLLQSESLTPEPPAPKRPYVPSTTFPLEQTIIITLQDGKLVHKFEKANEYYLQPKIKAETEYVLRHYHFPEAAVPPQYEHVLEHEGVKYQPTSSTWIQYTKEEFWRIAQLEIDTQPEVLLMGDRIGYDRYSRTDK